ncbi:hypothetical protein FHS32_001467 [Streptomyces albaduncus]|uniref:Transposase n=1 Tax=Streptomyces griseoloalbus TaxID=67303 RepID=A0A7W8BJV4_9ACTN|nr:hypothetical protein [Streptomyces albaduncus]
MALTRRRPVGLSGDAAGEAVGAFAAARAPVLGKLRVGSFSPSLLERRPRIDQTLHAVIVEAYVHGVPPSADRLVKARVDHRIDLTAFCGPAPSVPEGQRERGCLDL